MTIAKSCALLGMLVLTTCTGCLRDPYHGQVFENRRDAIQFLGYWPLRDDHVEIEVRNPKTNQWEYLTHTFTKDAAYNGALRVETGDWYMFSVKTRIPSKYWKKTKLRDYSCDVRALSKNGAMQTFNASLSDTMDLSIDGPIAELMAEYHHGQELTIYAKR